MKDRRRGRRMRWKRGRRAKQEGSEDEVGDEGAWGRSKLRTEREDNWKKRAKENWHMSVEEGKKYRRRRIQKERRRMINKKKTVTKMN